MFAAASQQKIWLCTSAVDMRKSFKGLIAQVRNQLKLEPQSGHYFVFVNQRKTQMKVLYFEPSGYCIWAKRLEQGQFPVKSHVDGQCAISTGGLQMIIDGITVITHKQSKRYLQQKQ